MPAKPRAATLVLGYGNVDRQDDGAAWHILAGAARVLKIGEPLDFDDLALLHSEAADLMFVPQLTPEMAETLAEYERVCFVDVHTADLPDELSFAPLVGTFQTSRFTHHLLPASALSLSQALYGKQPQAVLLSVRGYEFGFSNQLSARTRALSERAVPIVLDWIREVFGSSCPELGQ